MQDTMLTLKSAEVPREVFLRWEFLDENEKDVCVEFEVHTVSQGEG